MPRIHNNWRDKRGDPHKFEDHNAKPGAVAFKKTLSQRRGRRAGNRFRREYVEVYRMPKPLDMPSEPLRAKSDGVVLRSGIRHHLDDTVALAFIRAGVVHE